MVALALGLALSRGPLMLLLLPLIAAFFFMTTAITYQFQGWLASISSLIRMDPISATRPHPTFAERM